jgi:hypothetical protein
VIKARFRLSDLGPRDNFAGTRRIAIRPAAARHADYQTTRILAGA